MEVFVLTVNENDFNDVSCYDTEEKAINAIITDIKDRNLYEENTDETMVIIEEMKFDIKNYGYWEDEENVRYDIIKCKVN
jgi:hypothetical protein